jgi:2-O-A-mannosyl-D-glycerate-specific PTS system IIC component
MSDFIGRTENRTKMMKMTTLTNASLMTLQTEFNSRAEAIYALTDMLNQAGKFHKKKSS